MRYINNSNGKHNYGYGLSDVLNSEVFAPLKELVKNYVITMRPYLLFVSGITGIAGLSLSQRGDILSSAILTVCFLLSYGFGQALTDCFQTDTDSISSPYRPLVSGKISRKTVLIISISGLLFIGITVLYFSVAGFILAIIASLGLATYTYFKRRWWGGPFYNAWIVGALFTIAYLCFMPLSISSFGAAYFGGLFAVFFGYANFVLTGYYKDVSADRETGYNTLLVKYGFKVSSYVSDVFALLMLLSWGVVMIRTGVLNHLNLYVIILAVPGIFTLVYSQVMLHRVSNEKFAYRAISPVVHSYILMIGTIAANARPKWGLPLCVFYAGYVITLKLRPMKEQI